MLTPCQASRRLPFSIFRPLPGLPGTLLLFALLILTIAGCGGGTASEPAASIPPEHGTPHDDEEEHLEHHIPEHRPPDFSSAVDQIVRRFGDLADMQSGSLPGTAVEELADIVRWLPEIAAESDMRRSAWEETDRLAEELTIELQHWAQLPPAERPGVQPKIERTIGSLTDLKGTEQGEPLQERTDG